MAALVRRALPEVCNVAVLLVDFVKLVAQASGNNVGQHLQPLEIGLLTVQVSSGPSRSRPDAFLSQVHMKLSRNV